MYFFGCSDAPVEYVGASDGQYRIANASAAGYLLYVGIGTPPDFSAAANAFSVTLPATLAMPLPGDGIATLYVVSRFRDSYGCISQNTNPTLLYLTPSGPIFAPVPPPTNVIALSKSNGNIGVYGQYPGLTFDVNPANMVYVWSSPTGPPDTTIPPAYAASITTASFSIEFGSYTPGTTNYIAVALYRGTDSAKSAVVNLVVSVPSIPSPPSS